MIPVTKFYINMLYLHKMIDNNLIKGIANASCNAFANVFTVAVEMLLKIGNADQLDRQDTTGTYFL